MNMTDENLYRERKKFFNERAGSWLDMCYRNPESGELDLHRKGFDRLFSLTPLKPGDTVLDVGCGSGVLVPMILERITPAGLLYELDFAEKMIDENRKLHDGENVRFIVADACETSLDTESCDVIFCFSCFPHFDHKQEVLTALTRNLRRDGVLVIAHFSSADELNRHHRTCSAVMHDHLPGETDMRSMMEAAGLGIDLFIDEPGFYFIRAKKMAANGDSAH
jgi:ubiquinone/menaquinone biosynthesis C-methylase UbiE